MRFHVGMKKLPVYMMFHVAFISYRPTWNLRRHCIVFVQNVINSIVFSDVLKSLHCIALKISCRVCLHENFAPDMKSHVCLFDRHEIWPDMSFMSPVSCKRYEAFVRRPIWKKSHVGRHETSCKRPLSWITFSWNMMTSFNNACILQTRNDFCRFFGGFEL